jgi:hypothetical protein
MNLLGTLLNAQHGHATQQIASRFGLSEDQAQAALGELVPALSRGLRNNATSPQGLDDLLGALSRGGHQRYYDDPSALNSPTAIDEGNGILGHILGSKDVSRQVASRAAERTGLDTGILKQMLPVVASLVMGSLAKSDFARAREGASQGGAESPIGGLLASFLDADKDGSVLDDIVGIAGRLFR